MRAIDLRRKADPFCHLWLRVAHGYTHAFPPPKPPLPSKLGAQLRGCVKLLAPHSACMSGFLSEYKCSLAEAPAPRDARGAWGAASGIHVHCSDRSSHVTATVVAAEWRNPRNYQALEREPRFSLVLKNVLRLSLIRPSAAGSLGGRALRGEIYIQKHRHPTEWPIS
jgi:hypothetical protein